MSRIKFYENIHILFWLIKDLSWVMIWKPLGISMIIPTVGFAIWFCIKTINDIEFYVYLATLFWILANALWMLLEFFQKEEYKYLSAILFILGLLSISFYIFKEIAFSEKK
ncbi:MAG: hypothetical protein OHK0036_07850 [Bacteroidia bacterium]